MIFASLSDDFLKHLAQEPLRKRFERVPYIQYERNADWGLLGFDKALTEDEVAFVKENVKRLLKLEPSALG